MIALACGSLICRILWGYSLRRGPSVSGNEVRVGVFNKIQDFSFSNIDHFSTPSLILRLTTDITNIQNSYMMIIRVLVTAGHAHQRGDYGCDSDMIIKVFLVSIPVLAIFLGIVMSQSYPRFTKMLKRTDELNADVQGKSDRYPRRAKPLTARNLEIKKFPRPTRT